jgi:hypothetical protein
MLDKHHGIDPVTLKKIADSDQDYLTKGQEASKYRIKIVIRGLRCGKVDLIWMSSLLLINKVEEGP